MNIEEAGMMSLIKMAVLVMKCYSLCPSVPQKEFKARTQSDYRV